MRSGRCWQKGIPVLQGEEDVKIFAVMGFGAGLVWLFHGGSFPHWHVGLVGYALFGVFFVMPLLFLILLLVSVLVSGFLDHLEEIRQEDSDSYL